MVGGTGTECNGVPSVAPTFRGGRGLKQLAVGFKSLRYGVGEDDFRIESLTE